MDVLIIAFAALMSAPWLIACWLARQARGDCVLVLNAWAYENRVTLLRCSRCWVPEFPFPRSDLVYVVYRVIVVDRQRRLRTGRASILGKCRGAKFEPLGVTVRWVQVREIHSPARRPTNSQRGPLWDRWIDG
jgi:hypothetical protein